MKRNNYKRIYGIRNISLCYLRSNVYRLSYIEMVEDKMYNTVEKVYTKSQLIKIHNNDDSPFEIRQFLKYEFDSGKIIK